MTKRKRTTLLALAIVTVLLLSLGTAVSAASNVLNVKAYTGAKILYNGQQLTGDTQPLIINDTTYVPIRMLMNNFGKAIAWDGTNMQVIITNGTAEAEKEAQLINLQKKNAELEKTIQTLNDKIKQLEDDEDISLSDIKETLADYFEDAGDDYLDDDDLTFTFSVSGDEDDISYTIKADFDDSREYDDLTDCSTSKIKSFMNAVKSKINSEIDGTDFEDADITGKLVNSDDSGEYVKYNGSSYTYSWDDDDEDDNDSNTSLSSIVSAMRSEFSGAGQEYFDDYGIDTTINISGDDEEIYYTIKLDFDDASDYEDLSEVSETDVRSFLAYFKAQLLYEIRNTDYEDAEITGKLSDANDSSLYVTYNGSTYNFSY